MENNFQIDSAAVSDRGLSEKRPQNEDSYLELNQKRIFAVADGVGGAQAGDVASQMAMEILSEAFENLQNGNDPEEVMKLAIDRANRAIYQMSQDLAQLSTMATTIVALHVSGNIATIGHVGDSRLYRLDAKGELYRETQDHSVVEEEVRAGRMTPEQAAYHPSRNVISRALGAEPTVEIDMKTIMFDPNTTFMLCSDGITRHIPDNEIKQLLNSGAPSAAICHRMKELCYERGAEDNLTAVIVKVADVSAGDAAGQASDLDFEEATVATARAGQAGSGLTDVPAAPAFPDENLDDEEFQTRDFSRADQISIPADGNQEEPTPDNFNTQVISGSAAKSIQSTDEREVVSYQNKSGSGILSKIFTGLVLLFVGAILGAAGYYFLMPKPIAEVPAPVIETPAENIAYKAFEDNRRNVDENPSQFINAIRNSAQDAEDFYLLGRAYLLTGKYNEAQQAFNNAKNLLAMTDQVNSKVLANEIAMGLAIIKAENGTLEFQKELPTQTNQNTIVPANRP